ncbi:MAG: PAS domain S-box protein [Desulfocapsaceae bacterium]|nr:PAS domain S-box protein [Desulfocapsaceae bacterium]
MNKNQEIAKIVSIYALIGCAWIYFSDTVVSRFVYDPALVTKIEIGKGALFIVCTSFLLYFLITRLSARINESISALSDSEERFRLAMDATSDGIWDWNIETDEVYFSPKYTQMLGYEPQEFKERVEAWSDLIFAADKDRVLAVNQECVEGITECFEVEYRMHTRDGQTRWILGRGRAVSHDGNGRARRIVGTHIDITDRKKAEDALRESNDTFRLTFDFSPDSVNINRLVDGLYVDINEGFTRTTGYTREDVLGRSSLDLNIWHNPADRRLLTDGLLQKGFYENLESQFKKKNGELITGLMSARIITLKGVKHIISITRDITEHKTHEKERLKLEKLESLGILAGGIAHDFNNILTGIMGNISFAKVFLDTAHKSYKPLDEAERAAVRAEELAHQLLTFARGGKPIKKMVSPRHLVNEALSFVLHGSNVKGIAEIPDNIHALEVDAGQISQVFQNIIINAAQAMPGGGILAVTAANEEIAENNTFALPPGPYIRLSFTDQGSGISEENLKKIFDPYFTTKSAGIGLGLSSVHSIISRHGGHISVESTPGRGTIFTLRLPSTGASYTAHQTENAVQESCLLRGGSVLVMDDDQMIRDVASSMLVHLGYSVTTCASGEEAVEVYRSAQEAGHPFLMGIMDLTIPGGLGGKEAAQQILSFAPKACLVVSSGYSNDPIISNFKEYGFCGAIAKPYNIGQFKEILGALLPRK